MVLGSFGVDIAEAELRERCDCTPYYGTDALMAVDAARQLGFGGTAKHTLTLEELRTVVTNSRHPIVFVDLSPIDGTEDIHTLVVVGVSQDEISVSTPLRGSDYCRFKHSVQPGAASQLRHHREWFSPESSAEEKFQGIALKNGLAFNIPYTIRCIQEH